MWSHSMVNNIIPLIKSKEVPSSTRCFGTIICLNDDRVSGNRQFDYQFLRTISYCNGVQFFFGADSEIPHIQDEFGVVRNTSIY